MKVEDRINEIEELLTNVEFSKAGLAAELLSAKNSVNWKKSSYRSWKNFCNKCVDLSHSAIYVYVKVAELSEFYGFEMNDQKHIVTTIGWERFKLGLSKLSKDEDEDISVAGFIKKFKDISLNERAEYEKESGELQNFSFNLLPDQAEDLNNLLLVRGMRVTNRSRSNLTGAMSKLISDAVTSNL